MTSLIDTSPEPGLDAAEALKARLRSDLKLAMRARASLEVGVLRAIVAALDNAQAVPVSDSGPRYVVHAFGDASVEVPRLGLDTPTVESLIGSEIASRVAAADQFERLGRAERATELRAEAAIVGRYLTD